VIGVGCGVSSTCQDCAKAGCVWCLSNMKCQLSTDRCPKVSSLSTTRSREEYCSYSNRPCCERSYCTIYNRTPRCIQCPTGFLDCDAEPNNFCETSVLTDALHCGSCFALCPSVANSISICSNATCAITCNTGFCNNDGLISNGCEIAC